MKNLLVPIEINSSIDSVLATALLVGRRFDSFIEGTGLGPDLPDLVVGDLPIIWTVADQNGWRELVEEDRRRFETFMKTHDIPMAAPNRGAVTAPNSGPTYGWTGGDALGDSLAGRLGRIFNLSVVGRPGPNRGDPRMATAETILFESGRPVLLAPPQTPAVIGETIVISWNQSVEAARAVTAAMPFLLRAQRVVVLTVEGNRVEGPRGEDLAVMLGDHGILAEAESRAAKSQSNGEAILDAAASLGADLLIKGAYTQSRLRQMLFGGATTHILTHAAIPVLMTA